MTLEAFLAWEEQQELRWEFDGFAPVAMTGGTWSHSAIQQNLAGCLYNMLRGKPCRSAGSDMKIIVDGCVRYPDAFVVCRPLRPDATAVTEPVVIFEILSPSTAHIDLGAKNQEYRDTPSVLRYVILHQDRRQATVFERLAGDWVGHIFIGDATLAMPEIGIDLPLIDIYEGVDFPPPDTGNAPPQA